MTALDLRPLSLGELLDRTFFLYRRHFLLFTGIAAIPYSLFFVVNLASTLISRISATGARFPGQPSPAAFGLAAAGGGILALIVILAGFIAYLFSIGASVFAVSEIYAGHQTSIGASLNRVRGHAGTVFGVLFLSGLIVMGGFILLVIPAFYFACRICVATAAALLEDIGPADAIRRSFELTKDFAGRAFLIYLLAFAMAFAVVGVLQFPFGILIAVYAKQPQLVTILTLLTQVGSFIGNVLVAPVSTIAFALFYYDLRVRKEAFDLQMMLQAIGGAPLPPPITGGVPSMFGRDVS
jgi:hypothetical protein